MLGPRRRGPAVRLVRGGAHRAAHADVAEAAGCAHQRRIAVAEILSSVLFIRLFLNVLFFLLARFERMTVCVVFFAIFLTHKIPIIGGCHWLQSRRDRRRIDVHNMYRA